MIGRTLGKYHIVERLGKGGMAEVFKAYQANLDRHVALKLIKTSAADDPDYLARFDREAKSAAGLRHPNIVQVYDFDVDADSGHPYLVMELIEGGTLADHIAQHAAGRSPLPIIEVARIVSEVGTALSYAHQHGVIHRDVKPANVMRDTSGRMILTDFGLAKVAARPGASASGLSIGTPDYMAPEQVLGQPVDARADLYALGIIVYQLLTGRLPFQADAPTAVMLKQVSEPPPDPRTIVPSLPESVAQAVLKCLAKQPDERYPSVDEFVAALLLALAEADPALAVPAPFATPSGITAPRSRTITPSRTVSMAAPYVVTLEIKPPPEPSLPPKVIDFIGRADELAYFGEALAMRNMAVIIGMPGVGKTALIAELIKRLDRPAQTFWHSFHEGEGVNALIWKLAGFLAWRDQPDLWNTLQGATQAGSQAPPPEVLIDYVFQMVRGKDYLLCFDDFHCVEDDPLLGQFVEHLQPAIDAGTLDVIAAAQRRPSFVREGDFKPLGGLSPADVRALLKRRAISLPDPLIDELHAHTDGNAELVMLAIDSLRRAKEPARLIHRLSESEQIERFLVKQIDEGLSEEERSVMSAVAVMLGYPGSRDALAAALDGAGVRRPLNDLVSRSLLTVVESDFGKQYTLNVMVRAFYYDLLGQRDRQAMHRRVADYYDGEEPDALRAALHFQRCGEHARAIRLIASDVWNLINRGEARAVRQLLSEGFAEKNLDRSLWVEVLLARGQVDALLGETHSARASYEAALAHIDADSPELMARACLGLGELLQDDAPQEALEWLRRGLDAVHDSHPAEEAAMHIRIGRILTYLGDHETALTSLRQGLKLLPPGPSRLHITALGNLGNIYCTRGDVERGLAYYHQVLDNAQRMNDYWAMAEVWINLGIELDIAGRWSQALTECQRALDQAARLGSLDQQARALLAMGRPYAKRGDTDAAKDAFAQCIDIARAQDWKALIIYAGNGLADVHLRLLQLDEAEKWLSEAEQLAQATGVREQLPETYRLRALVRLAQQRPAEALADAERSVALAREIESYDDTGIGLRVLGQAQWANDQREAALASFEESLRVLGERDPYEAACAKAEWGRCLKANIDAEHGDTLLREAGETFERLGVRRESINGRLRRNG